MTERKEPTAPQLYPELGKMMDKEPSTTQSYHGSDFRLTEISRLQKVLQKERADREALYKKYKRGINTVDWLDASFAIASMGLGAGGMTLIGGIITAPIAIGLEVGAGIFGLAGLAGNYIRRKLTAKAKKHNDIKTLADSKLNTISDHISKAMKDGVVTNDEFNLIMSEVEKYQQLKEEIRSKNVSLTMSKNELIQQGRELERSSLLQKLDSKSNSN